MAESWDSFSVEIEDIRDLRDRRLVIGTQRNRGRASGIDVEDRRAWLVELRDGKATSLRSFHDPEKALEAVGLRNQTSPAL
jgi:ketosteroid isomerase-like protein